MYWGNQPEVPSDKEVTGLGAQLVISGRGPLDDFAVI